MSKKKYKLKPKNKLKQMVNVNNKSKKLEEKNNNESFLIKQLNQKVDDLNNSLMKNQILDLSELLGNRRKLLFRNLISGIFKGIGIGIGVTVITAIVIILLRKIVTLNIPVIGEYIADIVDIVEKSR